MVSVSEKPEGGFLINVSLCSCMFAEGLFFFEDPLHEFREKKMIQMRKTDRKGRQYSDTYFILNTKLLWEIYSEE
jgi:hypothetical protein